MSNIERYSSITEADFVEMSDTTIDYIVLRGNSWDNNTTTISSGSVEIDVLCAKLRLPIDEELVDDRGEIGVSINWSSSPYSDIRFFVDKASNRVYKVSIESKHRWMIRALLDSQMRDVGCPGLK